MKPWCLLSCSLMLAFLFCIPCSSAEATVPKAVVLDLSMTGDTVQVIGSRVVNNYPPDNRASERIRILMFDEKGTLIAEEGIDDPRLAYVEEGVVIRDAVNFSVIVPFRKDLASISLVNGSTGASMIAADVSGSVKGYCSGHGGDPDCAAAGPGFLLIGGIAAIVLLLAGTGYFILRKKGAPEQKQAGP